MVVLDKEIGRHILLFLEITYPLLKKIDDEHIANLVHNEYNILLNTLLFLNKKRGHLFPCSKMRNSKSKILLSSEDIDNCFCYIYFSLMYYFEELPKKFLFLGKDLFIKIRKGKGTFA